MKKIMAVVLSLVMLLSMVATVSAASVAELTEGLPNPLNLTLAPVVGARLGTSNAAFSNDLDISADGATAKTVDYQAKLDMSLIRAIFGGDMITNVFADDTAKAEFDAATISSTITIAITYPAGVTIPADWTTGATAKKGFTQIGSIFEETPGSRTDSANTVTITVTSVDKTAAEFEANVNEYFKDIIFDLPDVVSYTALGTYNVGIAVTGSTTANFASEEKTINYSGSATSTVALTQTSTPSRPSTGGTTGGTTGTNVQVPVTGDDHSVHVDATVSGSTVTVDKIHADHIGDVAGDAEQTGNVTIDATNVGDKVTAVAIPTQTMKDVAEELKKDDTHATHFEIDLPNATVEFDTEAAEAVAEQAAGSKVTIEVKDISKNSLNTAQKNAVNEHSANEAPVHQVVAVTAKSNGVEITDFKGGNVKVQVKFNLPEGYNGNTVKVHHVDKKGNLEQMNDAHYDKANKRVIWTTTHFSDYVITAEKEEKAFILTINEYDAMVFGVKKTNDVVPKLVNDRTMLPARFVAENLDATVVWTAEEEDKVLITKGDIEIIIYIGSDIAYVNGKEVVLDSVAFLENDRTYTPVRFVAESLGANVFWNELDPDTVTITK